MLKNEKMAIIRITKRFIFEMAHALHGYDGLCRNIHGHSYVLWVTISGEPIHDETSSKKGMLLDFSVFSKMIKEHIISELDHSFLLYKETKFEKDILQNEIFGKLRYVDYQPTCENLLLDMAEKIQKLLPDNVKLHSLKLQETESSYAEWYREDNQEYLK